MTFQLSQFTKSLNSAFTQLLKDQSETLSIEIAANFIAGMTAAEKHKSTLPAKTIPALQSAEPEEGEEEGLTTEEKAVIALLLARFLGSLTKFNDIAKDQVLAKVKEMAKAGSTQGEIKQYVNDIFEGKENITIDNTGKKKKELYVDKDLKISEVDKVISKPFIVSVLTYSSLLGETLSHVAYESGRKAQYQRDGYSEWVFVGPADEIARSWHVALLGCVFIYGTEQSNYAENVLSEPRCRHRAIPFFGDSRDTKKEVWDRLKEKNGLYWSEELQKWDMK